MQALPENILQFLRNHHVVGLATFAEGQPWAASCFYTVNAEDISLILLSSRETRHGVAMLANPQVAGTIAGQPESVLQIRGIQFSGRATLLDGKPAQKAYHLYCERHPIARLKRSDVWQVALEEIKHTDNAKVFGSKTIWHRTS